MLTKRLVKWLGVLVSLVILVASSVPVMADPAPLNDDCEMGGAAGVAPSNTWAWTYATEQFGNQVQNMTRNDSTYRFLQDQVGTVAAEAVYNYRSTVARQVKAAASQNPSSAQPGGDATYRGLRNGHGVPGPTATKARTGAMQRIQAIYSWIIGGGCG